MFGVLIFISAFVSPATTICSLSPWQEKAIIPFALADFAIFVGLYAMDRGMKAEKKLAELEQVNIDRIYGRVIRM